MAAKKYYSFLTLFLIGILCINLLQVQGALADEGTPTEPPAATEVVTEPPAAASPAPIASEPVPQEATVIPVTAPSEEAPAPTTGGQDQSVVLIEGLENTEIVVLDEQGQALVLGSQDAVTALGNSDPVWCPQSVTTPTPGANGCTVSYASITDILAAMQTYPESFSENGTIFLEQTSGAGFTTPLVLDDSKESLGPSFNSLSVFNLTIQGGWNPATGSTSGQTAFSGPNAYIQVGSLTNPWLGSLAINNVSVTGASQDAIQIFASNVGLTNVSATYNGGNGISITAHEAGTVALTNVDASHNGHLEGAEHIGSGVYIAGAATLIEVSGGTFVDNTRYGIEAMNSISDSLARANLWTDQADYAPGSVVTISGNSNSLNGNNIGFIFGEAVHVDVQGPNGYTASCEATANSFGGWSCQITLWESELAVGDYSYIATGLTSGVLESGIFSDSQPQKMELVQPSMTISQGGSAVYTVNVTMTGNDSNCTVTLSVTGLPAGASASFSGGNVVTTNTNFSKTFTITTTSGTPAGQHSFTVQADQGGNCQGNKSVTVSGELIVTAASTPTSTTVPPTSTSTNTPTNTSVPPTNTSTSTPTNTVVPPTSTSTSTPTGTTVPPTNTSTSTPTSTTVPPTSTSTSTPTGTVAPPTNTSTSTPTGTTVPPTNTATATPTGTVATSTSTATSTPTGTQPATATVTSTPTNTPTSVQSATSSPTSTPTASVVPSSTGTIAPTATNTQSTSSAFTAGTPRPRPSPTTSSAFVIPLTGGDLIQLDCNSVFWAFGIKLTFFNLCDQQTSIHSVGETELPSQLPTGYTYVKGLKIDIFTQAQILKELPANSGIEMDFPLYKQPQNQFAVLYWSDPDGDGKGKWMELSEQINASKISQALATTTGEELYQIIQNAGTGFFPTLTTEKTGIFILVKK